MNACGWELAPIEWWQSLQPGTDADWVGAVGTTAAVIVALTVALAQSSKRQREQRGREAATAQIFSMTLSAVEAVMPRVADALKGASGKVVPFPEMDHAYGLGCCRELANLRGAVQQLPFNLMQNAVLTVGLAEHWISAVLAARSMSQNQLAEEYPNSRVVSEESLKLCHRLAAQATDLRKQCSAFVYNYERCDHPFRFYMLGGRKRWHKRAPAKQESELQGSD